MASVVRSLVSVARQALSPLVMALPSTSAPSPSSSFARCISSSPFRSGVEELFDVKPPEEGKNLPVGEFWERCHTALGAKVRKQGMQDRAFEPGLAAPHPLLTQPPGRAWKAEELRRKSFEDLHTLWYVTLKEKMVLLSLRAMHQANGRSAPGHERSRMIKVRQTMARIKTVRRA